MDSVQWDCYECQQVFPTKLTAGKAVATASNSNDSTVVHDAIGVVRLLNGRHPVCPICQCHYEDEAVLLQHWQSYTNCEPCNVHLLPSWSLQAHYSTSEPHPKCQRCGFGFKDDLEYNQHLNDACYRLKPDDTPTPGPSRSSILHQINHDISGAGKSFIETGYGGISEDVRTSEVDTRSGNDGSTSPELLIDAFAAGELQLDRFETQVLTPPDSPDPSSVRVPAAADKDSVSYEDGYSFQSRESPQQDELASPTFHDLSANSSSVGNYSHEASEQSGSAGEESSTYSDARIGRAGTSTPSSGSSSAPSTPRISSFSGSLMCNGTSGSARTNGVCQSNVCIGPGSGHTTTVVRRELSWHCRLCEKNPCELPVTTMCGHLFCHGCIVTELDLRNPCCPVCKRNFFVSLHV
ncbi:hypothetical protein C8Q80DRAFT_1179179 [Daedaleopsis nitida]|nr:hypothetical protein C8Q80DRAFT_1179179 [Daedaleopsis nitida]